MAAQDDNFSPLDDSRYRPAFDVVLRGYDRPQVDKALSAAENENASLEQERELAFNRLQSYTDQIEQLQRDVYSLNQHLKRAEHAPVAVDRASVTAQVEEIMRLAEVEAAAIRSQATSEAAALKEETRTAADEMLARARIASEELRVASEERYIKLEAELKAKSDAAAAELAERISEQRKIATAEAAQARQQAQEEVERIKRDSNEAAAAEAERFVAAVKEQAGAILAQAEQDGQQVIKASRATAANLVAKARAEHEEVRRKTASLADEQSRITSYLNRMQQTLTGFGPTGPITPEAPRTVALESEPAAAKAGAPVEGKATAEIAHPATEEAAKFPEPLKPRPITRPSITEPTTTRLQLPQSVVAATEPPKVTPSPASAKQPAPAFSEALPGAIVSPRDRMAALLAALDDLTQGASTENSPSWAWTNGVTSGASTGGSNDESLETEPILVGITNGHRPRPRPRTVIPYESQPPE